MKTQKVYRNRDWLWEYYIVRKESSSVMAKEAGCGHETIRKWLHKYGIPVRSRGEGIFLAKRNSVIIAPGFLEFLKGEIIGDGYVGMPRKRSAHYAHTSKHKEYVVWLSGRFAEWGIEQVGQINRRKDKRTGAISYNYQSKSYPELVPIRKRWYPNGKKIVPQDLRLTPIIARQWYLGDGGLTSYKSKHPGIVLATCDFDRQSIDHLIEELNRLGFKATYQPANNSIYLSAYSVKDFLEWIGPCPISCYDYKWNYSKGSTE